MLTLDTPLSESRLPSLSPSITKRLREGLRIETIRDLLWHLPVRYEDRSAVSSIGELAEGAAATIIATVQRLRVARTIRRRMSLAEATVGDPTGTLQVVWFHQPWMAERLRIGDQVLLTGKISQRSGRRYLANPSYQILQRGAGSAKTALTDLLPPSAEKSRGTALMPIYPETEGITSRWIQYLVQETLRRIGTIPEDLPKEALKEKSLLSLRDCLRSIHVPDTRTVAQRGRRELLFRELFALQCAVLLSRAKRESHQAIAVALDATLMQTFLKTIPFPLTEAQRVAAYEILRDLEKPRPMRRLLIGDVGSGKTIVAAIAALAVVKTGKGQAALMAPTEILAKQHFKTLADILVPFGVRVALLTGSEGRVTPKRIASEKSLAISKPKLFQELAKKEIHILVGTHALISRPRTRIQKSSFKPQGPLRFARLLLAIIDEQHRFGVAQRKRMEDAEQLLGPTPHNEMGIVSAGREPHLLSLTATPIPRTLALTIFGDLDVSTIRELPSGRVPITTTILSAHQENIAFEKIRSETAAGHQAFVICPLVSKSEKIETKAAIEEFRRISETILPELRIGLLHGQLKSDEKDRVMQQFSKKSIDVLVATPVVEVGIDIPNATVMVVLGAERFGLAQLYQFRGRVGRSTFPSFCFFLAGMKGVNARKRLETIVKAKSGSDVASADLAIRGPGELLGDAQSGIPDAAMQALGDIELITETRALARKLLAGQKLLAEPLFARRVARIRTTLHLS